MESLTINVHYVGVFLLIAVIFCVNQLFLLDEGHILLTEFC